MAALQTFNGQMLPVTNAIRSAWKFAGKYGGWPRFPEPIVDREPDAVMRLKSFSEDLQQAHQARDVEKTIELLSLAHN